MELYTILAENILAESKAVAVVCPHRPHIRGWHAQSTQGRLKEEVTVGSGDPEAGTEACWPCGHTEGEDEFQRPPDPRNTLCILGETSRKTLLQALGDKRTICIPNFRKVAPYMAHTRGVGQARPCSASQPFSISWRRPSILTLAYVSTHTRACA